MTEEQLHIALNSRRLSKNEIDTLVHRLVDYPALVKQLLAEIHLEDKNGTFNASWVFDHLMRKRLLYLLPYLDEFLLIIENLTSESCIRPMAHSCELLTEAYFKKKDPIFTENINTKQLERMVTLCFDWLIGQHKVATKVFSMTSLMYLGKKFDWIYPELKMVIEQNYTSGTAAYRSRSKKTLNELKKLGF